MTNLQYIIAKLFTNNQYPKILNITSDNDILRQLVFLLIKYSDNRSIIVNINEDHFKFWFFESLNRGQTRYVWGKIGGTPSIKDISESEYVANEKKYQKIRKGYREII